MDERRDTEPKRNSPSPRLQESRVHVNMDEGTAGMRGNGGYPETRKQEEKRTYTSTITIQPSKPLTDNQMPNSCDYLPVQDYKAVKSPDKVTIKKKVSPYAALNKYMCEENDSAVENQEFEYHEPIVGNVKTYLEEKQSLQSVDETSTDSGVDSVDDGAPIKSKSFKKLQQMLDGCDEKPGSGMLCGIMHVTNSVLCLKCTFQDTGN